MQVGPDDVLLVVDVQIDFLPGGALAVAEGGAVLSPINRLSALFDHIVLTQDWHPADHISFAANHQGANPFDTISLPYGEQVLWPTHCVQGTKGAALAPGLVLPRAELIIRKDFRRDIDSYSSFTEADRKTHTGLAGYLGERGLRRVFLVGLATDFCVGWSALDARAAGFEAVVVEECCRAIDRSGSLGQSWHAMLSAGVQRIRTGAELC